MPRREEYDITFNARVEEAGGGIQTKRGRKALHWISPNEKFKRNANNKIIPHRRVVFRSGAKEREQKIKNKNKVILEMTFLVKLKS